MTLSRSDFEDIPIGEARPRGPYTCANYRSQFRKQSVPLSQPRDDSPYVIQLNKTPSNLTPSQRLKLRKSNINHSISQLKTDETLIINKVKTNTVPIIIDNRDEEVDDSLFNVPFSQQLVALSQREKLIFDNQPRNYSFISNSTRASSIFSKHSYDDDSMSSLGIDDYDCCNAKSPPVLTKGFNSISKDAQELTLLFNKDETMQISEESFQKRKLLAEFAKMDMPSTPGLLQYSSDPNGPVPIPDPVHFNKYHSFTRPLWLPPKATPEKQKHHRQSQDLIQNAILEESKVQHKRLQDIKKLNKQRVKDVKAWENSFLVKKNYQDVNWNKLKDLSWKGISSKIRGTVWWKLQLLKGNKQFDEKFCSHYFDRFNDIEAHINNLNNMVLKYRRMGNESNCYFRQAQLSKDIENELSRVIIPHLSLHEAAQVYDSIQTDILHVFPDMNYFQNEHQVNELTKIVMIYMLYLYEKGEACKFSQLYYPGLLHFAAILLYNFKNRFKVLITLCQSMTDRLPNLLLSYMFGPTETKLLIKDSLNNYIVKKFEHMFRDRLSRVFIHFKIHNIDPFEYLPNLLLSAFSNLFNFDLASHVIDLIFFSHDNDETIIKLILGYMTKTEYKLFGSKQEILQTLLGSSIKNKNSVVFNYVNVGYEKEFIDLVKGM